MAADNDVVAKHCTFAEMFIASGCGLKRQRRVGRVGPLQCDDPVRQSRLAGVADPIGIEVLKHRAADGPGGEQLPRFQRFHSQLPAAVGQSFLHLGN